MHLMSIRHKSPKPVRKTNVHLYKFCITSSIVSYKPYARPVTCQYPLVTTPHPIHGLSDFARLEVVPGVPYAEKPVASGASFEQDRLRGHIPVLSDGSCRSECIVTRLDPGSL